MSQKGRGNPSQPRPGSIPIKKLEAAVSQLETAIVLWFHDEDPASIYTLSYASHEIIRRIAMAKGVAINSIKDPGDDMTPEQLKAYRQTLDEWAGFFKHGGKDPDEMFHLWPKNLMWLMADAIRLYHASGFPQRPLMAVYALWVQLHNPSHLRVPIETYFQGVVDVNVVDGMRKLPKAELMKQWLQLAEATGQTVVFHKKAD